MTPRVQHASDNGLARSGTVPLLTTPCIHIYIDTSPIAAPRECRCKVRRLASGCGAKQVHICRYYSAPLAYVLGWWIPTAAVSFCISGSAYRDHTCVACAVVVALS